MAELVSILIAAYNAEKWISETIQSALDQTWPDKEIIVVDDGSTDNTLLAAGRFEAAGVRIIRQGNRGASAARNAALGHARGDYIQWLDADDLLAPDKIERQLEDPAREGNPRILLSGPVGTFYYRTSKAKFVINPCLQQDLHPVDWMLFKLGMGAWQCPHNWLVSRELTAIAGPWDERLSLDDDGEYFARIMLASEKVRFVRGAVSYYRVCSTCGVSRSFSGKAMESAFLSAELTIDHVLRVEDSARTREAALKFLGRWFAQFYHAGESALMAEAETLARELGGSLEPRADWKFLFVRKLFGPRPANSLKNLVWRAGVLARRNVDRLFSVMFGS